VVVILVFLLIFFRFSSYFFNKLGRIQQIQQSRLYSVENGYPWLFSRLVFRSISIKTLKPSAIMKVITPDAIKGTPPTAAPLGLLELIPTSTTSNPTPTLITAKASMTVINVESILNFSIWPETTGNEAGFTGICGR
jgi:hypothetical protein